MGKKKLLIAAGGVLLAAAVVVAVFALRGGEEAPVIPAPTEYGAAEQVVAALPAGDKVVVTEEAIPLPEDEEEETASPMEIEVAYHYADMEDPIQEIVDYCELLMSEEHGFVPVDAEMKQIELPEIGKKGQLTLVKPQEKGTIGDDEAVESMFTLQLDWSGADCSVSVGQVATDAVSLEKKPQPEPLTVLEAVDYLYGFQPAVLGLSGTSMMEYHVVALDGAVLVEGTPCLQLNVYSTDPQTGTHVVAGQYLFCNADRSVYEIVSSSTVEKITL